MSSPRDLDLARQLREARIAAGLTQDDLAAKLGVGRTAISKAESGTRSPRAQSVRRWMEACGLVLHSIGLGSPERAAMLGDALAALAEDEVDDVLAVVRAWPRLAEGHRQRILGLVEAGEL